MGECHCSKIAIMQLFHELKQQFPALPDHVVSQCIVQNSYDKATCERSLRASQQTRPPPGAFPPPAPGPEDAPDLLSRANRGGDAGDVDAGAIMSHRQNRQREHGERRRHRGQRRNHHRHTPSDDDDHEARKAATTLASPPTPQDDRRAVATAAPRAQRPVSLDVGECLVGCRKSRLAPGEHQRAVAAATSSSTHSSSSSAASSKAKVRRSSTGLLLASASSEAAPSGGSRDWEQQRQKLQWWEPKRVAVVEDGLPRFFPSALDQRGLELHIDVDTYSEGFDELEDYPSLSPAPSEMALLVQTPPTTPASVPDMHRRGSLMQHQPAAPVTMSAPATPSASTPTRGCTTINLTLRPPSCRPRPPIDVNCQRAVPTLPSSSGASTPTKNSSSCSPGFQRSHLRIDIASGQGHGGASGRGIGVGAGASAVGGNESTPPNTRATTTSSGAGAGLLALARRKDFVDEARRLRGLPAGRPSRPTWTSTTAASAPTSPTADRCGLVELGLRPSSLPTSPLPSPSTCFGGFPRIPPDDLELSPAELPHEFQAILEEVPNEYKELVTRQLLQKERLAKVVEAEERKLEALKKEVDDLSKPPEISPDEMERQLRSEIYQLQLACEQLAADVDKYSDLQVPLGETNEEFYKEIYTGQQCVRQEPNRIAPPVPSKPPALSPISTSFDQADEEEADGPSWVCERCTFDNHPLMNKCEECNMPRHYEGSQGTRNRSTNSPYVASFPSTSR